MMQESEPQVPGVAEPAASLRELLEAGRRSIAAYRAAEGVVADHRVQAALGQLRLDHERHVEELAALVGDAAGEGVAHDGGGSDGAATGVDPVGEAVRRGEVAAVEVLEALRAAESGLHAAYRRSVEHGCAEPVRAVLSRHWSEEAAHVAWLHEGTWLREVGAG